MNTKGPGWILCPSKKHPGFFYYFNVLSGETVWSLRSLPQSSPQDGNPSTFDRNVVQSRNPKTVEFGKAEFPKYINNPNHKQNRDVKRTDLWKRRVTQEINDNISTNSTETESFENVRVFKHKNKSTQRNFTTSQRSWWNNESELKPSNIIRQNARVSKPFRLKPPKIKTLNHYEPITSPILNGFGISCRNSQLHQKQEIKIQGSKQMFNENMESLNSDDLRWKIMMKKIQKSAGPVTLQMETKDEHNSFIAPKRKVKFFIDITDEESLKLNGDIGNDDAGTLPNRLVILNQNSVSRRTVQNEDVKENLFLQNTATFDPLALSKSLQTNELFSLRTNSSCDSNILNETCEGIKRLNLGEQLHMRHPSYSNVEARLSTLCTKYEDLQVYIMTARIEEWICCYLLIMEQFLHEIFQVTKATKYEPPCWFFQGLKRFKEVFSHHKLVCAITDLLLSMCGYCVKKGIVRTNIKPNQFIKLLCGGILLIEEFMKFTRDVDVLPYKNLLHQLIASIRNPNIIPDIQAIDIAYLGEVRYHTQQPHDYFPNKSQYGVPNASPTFGVSQKQPIKNKRVIDTNDSDCILQVSDDDLSNDRYDIGFNFANHKDSLINMNTQKNTDWENTDNIEFRTDLSENDLFHMNGYDDENHCNNLRLTRTASALTLDCNDVNGMFNGDINTLIVGGRKDNFNHDQRNSYGVIQGNDFRTVDNEVNRVSGDGNVNREKRKRSVDVVERNTTDESNVVDVIDTMLKTIRRALEALKVYCENCYNELRNGDLTEGRKEYLREATNQALAKVTAMLLELKCITKRDESKNSPIQQMLGDQGPSYRTCIKNCLSQTLIVESALKYVLQVIDEDKRIQVNYIK